MQRIMLGTAKISESSDSAGTLITKTEYPQLCSPGPYEQRQLIPLSAKVPPLAYFCLSVMLPYPEQLSCIGRRRLHYTAPSDATLDWIVALESRDPSDIDPRLWAIIVQLYSGLRPQWRVYQMPLRDKHLTLLQRIPSTQHFALITVLELAGNRELTDDNILELKHLRTLVALNISETNISDSGIFRLANTVSWVNTDSHQRELRGPWSLRALDLHGCRRISEIVGDHLEVFRLLSVLGQCAS